MQTSTIPAHSATPERFCAERQKIRRRRPVKQDFRGKFVRDEEAPRGALRGSRWAGERGGAGSGGAEEMDDSAGAPQTSPINTQPAVPEESMLG